MTNVDCTFRGSGSERRRFTRFILFGAIAALANWLSRFALSTVTSFEVAVVLAYLVGMVVAFTLFRRFVFPISPLPMRRQILFFVIVNIAGIAQVWTVSVALVTYALPAIGHDGELWRGLAHGIAIGVPTISSYVGHKFLTFGGGARLSTSVATSEPVSATPASVSRATSRR